MTSSRGMGRGVVIVPVNVTRSSARCCQAAVQALEKGKPPLGKGSHQPTQQSLRGFHQLRKGVVLDQLQQVARITDVTPLLGKRKVLTQYRWGKLSLHCHSTPLQKTENICNRVKPPPVTKIHIAATQDLQQQQEQKMEQAPSAEIKKNSLTSKELCKGSAQQIPLPGLRRLNRLHTGFPAARPDPDTLTSAWYPGSCFFPFC